MRKSVCLSAALLGALSMLAAAAGSAGTRQPSYYLGYSGTHWERDYAVSSGHCDRAAIVEMAGTPIGTHVTHDNPAAATLIGTGVRTLIGGRLAREIDDGDRACLGHTLEIGKSGRRVVWDNLESGVHYEIVPDDGHNEIAGLCRNFSLLAKASSGKSKRRGTACQKGPGLWQMIEL
jgi:surface antigen